MPKLLPLLILLAPTLLQAQELSVIPLWKDGAPGSESRRHEPEQAKDWWVKNIHDPSLTVVEPPKGKANGTAVVICPGGGHRELVFEPEGMEPARYLARLGITAFALKYRLARESGSSYTLDDTRADIQRAMRVVRANAAKFGIDPNRIGVMGWSAGAELAAMVAYPNVGGDPKAPDPIDRVSARPNFQIIIYPGGHGLPLRVGSDAPPLFLLVAMDDQGSAKNSIKLLQAYQRSGASVEAHFIAEGQHAFNMGNRSSFVAIRKWPERMADWLIDRKLAGANSAE